MKLITIIYINNATAYGGVKKLRQVVLFVFLGNPIVYKGNYFTWSQGRKLVSGSMSNNEFEYSYDGNGMRYKKVGNGVTTEYYYNGTQLLMENRDGERIYYIYGVTGIEGMLYSGYGATPYYFDKNTLGDIIAIRDGNGNIVARYEYDAWGNCTVIDASERENTSSTFIGNINPFRYRGYYYDTETGFYYLQTRYYDPSICRFINADNYELVSTLASTPGQLNLYAYCNNNPIMFTDETGENAWPIVVLFAVVMAIFAKPHNATVMDDTTGATPLELDSGEIVYYTFSPNNDHYAKSRLKIYNSFQYTNDEQEKILKELQSIYSNHEFNIDKMKNEWGWHNLSYAFGWAQSQTASVDMYINGDDVGHGAFSWIMNNIHLFG